MSNLSRSRRRRPSRELADLVLQLARGEGVLGARIPSDCVDELVHLARAHQVEALCYWRWRMASLETGRAHAAPQDAPWKEFHSAFVQHSLWNAALAREIAALCGALGSRGVEALFFKGPWLAFAAFPDPGTRPVGDIDLGVRERDYRAALDALAALGYRANRALPADGGTALRQAHHFRQLGFDSEGKRPLELHFRLINIGPPTLNEGWVWDSRAEVEVDSVKFDVPGPAAMLLHLVVHANQHRFGMLRHLYDIHFALMHLGRRMDWPRFLGAVEDHRCRTSAFHSLLLARDLTGAAVPPSVLDSLRPGAFRCAVFSGVWGLDRARALAAPMMIGHADQARLYLLEMGTPLDKARYVFEIARCALAGFARSRP